MNRVLVNTVLPGPKARDWRASGRILAAALSVATGLAGCTTSPPGTGINDPYEKQNREVHRFNQAVDSAVFGGPGTPKEPFLPPLVAEGIGNFASNLGLPSATLNGALQARPKTVFRNGARFVVNTTLGIAGLFDPASRMGLAEIETDFGETLHVWGVREGAYVEAPLIGPTTERDLAGKLVDMVIDPLNGLPTPERYYATGINVTSKVDKRLRYSDTVDSILYGSADSYAQARLLYLQNRHYKLGIQEEVFDPYADPYGQ